MTPKVSIVMPVFNEEQFIDSSIQSMIQQRFNGDYEIIVIDDGSTDGTTSILEGYDEEHKNVKLIKNEENKGITKSLNIGLEKAQGHYIARQDGNDLSLPTRLQVQYDFLEENPHISLVGTSCIDVDELGEPYGVGRSIVSNSERIARILPLRNCLIHTSIMFRNTGWRYREKFHYAQDYDLYLRMLTDNSKLTNIDRCLVKSRHNPGHIGDSKGNIQRLFGEMAKEFYYQRISIGKDRYQKFEPETLYQNTDVQSEPHPHRKNMYLYLKNGNKIDACGEFYKSMIEEKNGPAEFMKMIFALLFPPIYQYSRNSPRFLRLIT